MDTTNRNYFNIQSPVTGRVLKPHVRSVGRTERDRLAVAAYCMKDGDFMCSPGLSGVHRPVEVYAHVGARDGWAFALRGAQTVDEGMETLRAYFPVQYYMYGQRIRENLIAALGAPSPARSSFLEFVPPPLI